jgi:hypothetical protein
MIEKKEGMNIRFMDIYLCRNLFVNWKNFFGDGGIDVKRKNVWWSTHDFHRYLQQR